jgi:hypothetical protein
MSGHPVPEWNYSAFSPDGRMMARTLDGHKIQLLETATSKILATLEAPEALNLGRFQFSPDGTRLAAMEMNQQVQLWDLRLLRQDLAQMNLDWDLPPYPPDTNALDHLPATLEIESDAASAKN